MTLKANEIVLLSLALNYFAARVQEDISFSHGENMQSVRFPARNP